MMRAAAVRTLLRVVVMLLLAAPQPGIHAQRYDLSPGDARRVEDLRLQQRLQRELLEQQQGQRQRMLERNRSFAEDGDLNRRLDLQRDLLRQERELQAQLFELDQHRLIQSLPRQVLQPRFEPGRLNLP